MLVAPGIKFLRGSGGASNIYALENGDEVVLIDSGDGTNLAEIKQFAGKKKISFVLLTHGHYDHVIGALKLGVKSLIAKDDLRILKELNEDFAEVPAKPGNFFVLPNEVRFGDFVLEAVRTPGHTPGSVCFFERKRNVLFSGDTLFADGVGRTDLFGGDSEKLDSSLELAASLGYAVLCPGHGAPLSVSLPV